MTVRNSGIARQAVCHFIRNGFAMRERIGVRELARSCEAAPSPCTHEKSSPSPTFGR
jgi:hypothetical protein